MRLLLESNEFLRSRWFAPTLHILLFAATWLAALAQAQPLLDGPARWPFGLLFVADLPISLVAFSAIWMGKLVYALLLWGVLGTAWWYLLGVWIRGERPSAGH